MNRDGQTTDVIFKMNTARYSNHRGTVDAIFPGIAGTCDPFTVQVYSHVGQHSAGTVGYWRVGMRPATPEEYAPLLRELELIGYRVRVVKRCTAKHLAERRAQLGAVK